MNRSTMANPGYACGNCRVRIAIAFLACLFGSQVAAQDFPGNKHPTTKWTTDFVAGRYKIHCDFSLASPQDIVAEFRALEADIESLLGWQPPRDATIHLVLFQTAIDYQRYMEAHFPSLPKRRALYIQYRGPGMLFAHLHADVIADLRHEVTHALLNDGKHPLPLWLDEGLAEYFEPKREERFAANRFLAEIASLPLERGIRPIRDLQAISDVNSFTEDNYRDSWAWVHYLLHRKPETRELLARYLEGHWENSPKVDLGEALARMFPKLREDMHQHFLASKANERQVEPAPP